MEWYGMHEWGREPPARAPVSFSILFQSRRNTNYGTVRKMHSRRFVDPDSRKTE